MKDSDVFEITIRRFYTDGNCIATPMPSRILHITDAQKARDNIHKCIEGMLADADNAVKQLPGGVFITMTKESVDALLAQEEGEQHMASVQGMTKQ